MKLYTFIDDYGSIEFLFRTIYVQLRCTRNDLSNAANIFFFLSPQYNCDNSHWPVANERRLMLLIIAFFFGTADKTKAIDSAMAPVFKNFDELIPERESYFYHLYAGSPPVAKLYIIMYYNNSNHFVVFNRRIQKNVECAGFNGCYQKSIGLDGRQVQSIYIYCIV